MSGHKPFSELTKHFSPERNAMVEAETHRLLEEMTLRELREALHIKQRTDPLLQLCFVSHKKKV